MSDGTAGAHPIFPGSRAAAHMVAWIDRVLEELGDGRRNDARAALEGETWRTGDTVAGVPPPILEQVRDDLRRAAEALADERESAGVAEEALLSARARFMPGG
ncbi:MAG TPA: hypothetical protein VHG91_21445 [Longimicrobium sp.]|nr:hypothetical protein [Longimicrobium sp.]